ncbi:putative bifunctional diguanylate cyclase/phosphodiesterase [Xylophilus sp.]|uniref:putative bifunctional diguanylate cyclase/phosphodiesterase n=1 Tax=Xylophilus sp. TaxID=2653893 RepID=UPI0013BCCCF0|nr:EAL domain-containing protein [Xylophilus sp.]KAF1044402.1 MAG: putative signaling protein [Xylophilus sp.]
MSKFHRKPASPAARWHADAAGLQASPASQPPAPAFQVAQERAALVADLHFAVQRNQFELHYQPQFGIDGRLLGAEALIRWRHARLGLILPGRFIALAEETGLIIPIGSWVLEEACRVLRRWSGRGGLHALVLSVNVSARQLQLPDFVDRLEAQLRAAGVAPHRLRIELTESVLIGDMDAALSQSHALRRIGVGLSLDDFGTGYSSLSYLWRLPLDELKIDQSFTRDMLGNDGALAIVRLIIELGHSLRLTVLAEGVETVGQRDGLAALGCDAFQGFLYGMPVPLADCEARHAVAGCAGP